jgi:hypothetical protein
VFDPVTFARTLHGHCGLLAAIALFHPALTLHGDAPLRRSTRIGVVLATTLLSLTVVGGWLLYPGYREGDKRRLLTDAPVVARLFETKEHLAWYALVLAWAGLLLVLAGTGRPAARTCFGIAAGLAFLVGMLGSAVGAS